MEYFFPSRYKIPDYGPMTEEDWEHFHDEVMRVFEAVKPRIRNYIDTTHMAPTMDDIQKMGEDEMSMLRWHHEYHDIVNCHKLHGLENVWKHMREQLDQKCLEYQITPQKLRLKLEIKGKDNMTSTYVISYAGFMKNPNVDNYINN